LAFIRASEFLLRIPHLLFLHEREWPKVREEFGMGSSPSLAGSSI